jgi:hypothetical protein
VRKEYPPDVLHLLSYRSHALWLEKDLQGAARSYRETIKQLHSQYLFIRIPGCLEGLGKIAVLQNDFERAARLFGAAEAMRGKMGTRIPPIWCGEYQNSVSALAANMDDAEFKRIWAEGRAMSIDEAAQYGTAED